LGVAKNAVIAVKWYRKAAEQGFADAQYNLGLMYSKGLGVVQDYSLAYVWSTLAAANGIESAAHNRDIYAAKLTPDALNAAQKKANKMFSGELPTDAPSMNVSGTCFFVDSSGTAITNNHVVAGSSSIEVVASDGSKSPASVIKSSKILDIAVLSTGHQTPQFLTLAPSKSLALGQKVFTIGYPATNILGASPKFSEGSISALSGLNNDDSWIQVSTPIQPGNSGGPLVDENGQVVGIVTATAAVKRFFEVTGSLPQNINWAIKAEYARALIPEVSTNTRLSNRQEVIEHTGKSVCSVIAH